MRASREGPAGGPTTALGVLRREGALARTVQLRVSAEWDRTLALLRSVDFSAPLSEGDAGRLRGEVEIWNDLTLEPARRISRHGTLLGLSREPDEAYEYLHRVFVGTDPASYLDMCDRLDQGLSAIMEGEGPQARPELRDMTVELMELGVRSSSRCLEWLERRLGEEGG